MTYRVENVRKWSGIVREIVLPQGVNPSLNAESEQMNDSNTLVWDFELHSGLVQIRDRRKLVVEGFRRDLHGSTITGAPNLFPPEFIQGADVRISEGSFPGEGLVAFIELADNISYVIKRAPSILYIGIQGMLWDVK